MDSSPTFLLLIEEHACSGSWNMALDEALLEAALHAGITSLRFFRWSEPTLSLGYFQKQLPPQLPVELQQLPRVRRLSGGGAILHHLEWTYSCALPASHLRASDPLKLYELVHQEFIGLLREQGIPAGLRGEVSTDNGEEPFLCFGRKDPRDIVLADHKVLGSAQRRRRGAILQHGSLLLKCSPFAPLYPGLSDLADKDIPIDAWIPDFAGRISNMLGAKESDQIGGELPRGVLDSAKALERDKYVTSTAH
jgi:lipoate-protein ligase A